MQDKFLHNIGFDPNDPRNDELLELLKSRNAEQSGLRSGKMYRFEPSLSIQLQPGTRAPAKRAKFLQQRWLTSRNSKLGWVAELSATNAWTAPLSVREVYGTRRNSSSRKTPEGLTEKGNPPKQNNSGVDQSVKLGLISGTAKDKHTSQHEYTTDLLLDKIQRVNARTANRCPSLEQGNVLSSGFHTQVLISAQTYA